MSIVKYQGNPLFASVNRDEFLTPFDKIFDDFFATTVSHFSEDFGPNFFSNGSYPKVDVTDQPDKVVIEAEIPGLTKDDVNIEVTNDVLTIIGNKVKSIAEDKGEKKYIRKELRKSSFRRSFTLGDNLDKVNIDAKFEHGLLNITLKKIKPSIPETKRIEIK